MQIFSGFASLNWMIWTSTGNPEKLGVVHHAGWGPPDMFVGL